MSQDLPATLRDIEQSSEAICRAVGIALAVALKQIGPDAKARFLDAFETYTVDKLLDPNHPVSIACEAIQAGIQEARGE